MLSQKKFFSSLEIADMKIVTALHFVIVWTVMCKKLEQIRPTISEKNWNKFSQLKKDLYRKSEDWKFCLIPRTHAHRAPKVLGRFLGRDLAWFSLGNKLGCIFDVRERTCKRDREEQGEGTKAGQTAYGPGARVHTLARPDGKRSAHMPLALFKLNRNTGATCFELPFSNSNHLPRFRYLFWKTLK